MFSIKKRYSKAIESIKVNPFTATCEVTYRSNPKTNGYKAGDTYTFKNVNRFKLLNLILNDNLSFGFWNKQLKKFAVYENKFNVQTGALTYALTDYNIDLY